MPANVMPPNTNRSVREQPCTVVLGALAGPAMVIYTVSGPLHFSDKNPNIKLPNRSVTKPMATMIKITAIRMRSVSQHGSSTRN